MSRWGLWCYCNALLEVAMQFLWVLPLFLLFLGGLLLLFKCSSAIQLMTTDGADRQSVTLGLPGQHPVLSLLNLEGGVGTFHTALSPAATAIA
jgi:hypothetical protein